MTFEEALVDAVAACRAQWAKPGTITSAGVADATVTADVMFVTIQLHDVIDRPASRPPTWYDHAQR